MIALRHPNVVLFMGACTKPPHLCIVMEYMGLGSLYDVSSERKSADCALSSTSSFSCTHMFEVELLAKWPTLILF